MYLVNKFFLAPLFRDLFSFKSKLNSRNANLKPQKVPPDPVGQNAVTDMTHMTLRSQTHSRNKRGLEVEQNNSETNLHPPRAKSPFMSSDKQQSVVRSKPHGPAALSPGSGSLQHGINITVNNEYELLSNEEGEDDEMPTLTPAPAISNPPPKSKKVRVPPISVVGLTTKQVREVMSKSDISQTEYHMKATKTGVKLLCMGEEGYRGAVSALKTSKIQFHTFTPAAEQPVRIILSGLSVYDISELEAELASFNIVAAEVKLFSRKVVGLEESALYLLHFVKGSVRLSELRKVKAVFNTLVKWRYFERKPTDAVQCHRCQQFGHGMRNCNLLPLCVKCGEKHLSTECNLPKKADLELGDRNGTRDSIKCANCSGQHTANYRGCPSRKNYLEKLAKIRAERRNPAPPPPPPRPLQGRPSSSGNSYAEVLKNQSSHKNLFSVSEFLALAREMFDRLATCQTKQQQLLALFELTTKYVYNG